MKTRTLSAAGWIVVLMIGLTAASQAGNYGTSGEIGEVDLVNSTVQVGELTISVSASSVMLDRSGFRLSLSELGDREGFVSVTLYKVGGDYLLKTLQFYDADEDDG